MIVKSNCVNYRSRSKDCKEKTNKIHLDSKNINSIWCRKSNKSNSINRLPIA